MRLTLRTMLAYLDDMLEPEDAEQIKAKINESEFAASLVHRIHDVMRRLRIGAPKVLGRGMGADPNTVAEYLEDTLSAERVLEFEKVSLESDMQLAEVASCHQILTLVLGEPADVDPQMRQRMYQLSAGKEALRELSTASASAPSSAHVDHDDQEDVVEVAEIVSARHVPEVPDYLRDEPRTSVAVWIIAASVMILGVATGILVVKLGIVGTGTMVAQAPENGEGGGEQGKNQANDEAGDARPLPLVDEGAGDMSADQAGDDGQDDAATSGVADSAAEPGDETMTGDAGDVVSDPLANTAANIAASAIAEDAPLDGAGDRPVENVASLPADRLSPDRRPVDGGGRVGDAQTGMGRVLSQQMLLRHNPTDGSWRQAGSQMVYPGDLVASLPLFRSTVTLSAGPMIHVLGSTELQLEGPDGAGVPGIVIPYGRVIALTPGTPQRQLRIKAASTEGLLTFVDPESTVGIEVRAFRSEGSDPEQTPPLRQVSMFVERGSVLWQPPGQATATTLTAPMLCALGDAGKIASTKTGELAEWMNDDLSSLEKKAVENILNALADQPDRPAALVLKEVMNRSQRPEIRSLSACSLAMLGEYAPLVESLNDMRQRSFWGRDVECLRECLARSSEDSAGVRLAMEQVRGEDAAEMYRLLWGYTADGLAGGDARKLVTYLDHDDRDFRVLAGWNLQNITGHTLFYHPEDPQSKRAPVIQKWKQRLDAGQIVPTNSR